MNEEGAPSLQTAIIADDHPIVRDGLRSLLQALGVRILAEAANGLEAIAAVKAHRPTLLTLDAAMPLARGVEVLGEARRWSSETKIVVFTGLASHGLWRDLAEAGADGVFLKSAGEGELLEGIGAILSGKRVHSRAVAEVLAGTSSDLTMRERQIVSLIVRGQTNGEIAAVLGISPKTVDNHRTNIMRKLDVHSLAALIGYALREGLLDTSSHL